MNGSHPRSDAPPRGSLRPRLVIWVALPVLVLGASYFLFVEYVLESQGVGVEGVRIALRIGGGALIAIALVLAAACGFLLADRVSRPIRALLRLADTGDSPTGRSLFLHHRDWEVFQLYRRVNALVQQNQAGAKALEELESQRTSIDRLRQELQRTGQHGIALPVSLGEPGRLEPILEVLEANRARLVSFFSELRERVEDLRVETEGLQAELDRVGTEHVGATGSTNGPDLPIEGMESFARMRTSLLRLRRLGTVWSLETERLRTDDAATGEVFDRFVREVDEMDRSIETVACAIESAVKSNGQSPDLARMRDSWSILMEKVGSLARRLDEVRDR